MVSVRHEGILVLSIPLFACQESYPTIVKDTIDPTQPAISSEPAIPSDVIQSSGTQVTNIDQIVGMWIVSANPDIFLSVYPL